MPLATYPAARRQGKLLPHLFLIREGRMSLSMQNIDFASESGLALLTRLAERDARALVTMAGRAQRAFALASSWAPGAHFIGAQLSAPAPPGSGSTMTFSLAGCGETAETALISCLGEGVERVATVECEGDTACRLPLSEARPRVMPQAVPLIEELLGRSGDISAGVDWCHGRDLASGNDVLVPASWTLRRAAAGPLLPPDIALSTGVAAGSTCEHAAERALLELIERDAAALWWIGGRRGRPLALDEPAAAGSATLLQAVRQGAAQRATWLLDITTDLGVPCFVAMSASPRGDGLAFGFSARLSRDEAARAAIFEMCQMELGVQLSAEKLRQLGSEALAEADRRHLARATALSAESCDLLHPIGTPWHGDIEPPSDGLGHLQQLLAAKGMSVALVDLTRPALAVPVVRAIAPGLQQMPGGLVTERLNRAVATFGGGERWTGGLPLM
jgi:ribosomal protein S12 methylthiotransferase accessory factor